MGQDTRYTGWGRPARVALLGPVIDRPFRLSHVPRLGDDMAEVRLTAQARTDFGRGAARRLRRDGKVLSCTGTVNPRHVSLDGHDSTRR